MAEREVHYCTTEDGVRIAYSVEGDGSVLVVPPFAVETFAAVNLVPGLEQFFGDLGAGRRLVRYDGRGTGLSQRDVGAITPETLLSDLAAVIRELGSGPVILAASTLAGPRAIQFTVENPQAVKCLILYGTTARPEAGMPPQMVTALTTIARTNWPIAAQILADFAGRKEHPEAATGLSEAYMESTSGDMAAQIIEAVYQSDVSAKLPDIRCPTLVTHRLHDDTVPFWSGQEMAAQIPGCTFAPLEGTIHNPALGDTKAVLQAFTSFLRTIDVLPSVQQPGAFRTVLFTDLVGHTEMMRRLGDERGRHVLREHERITRETLKEYGGAEVKTMGDGFMASFGSVTKAIDCAIALQRAFAAHSEAMPEPLHVRVGLNAGEPIEEEGDLFGSTVILASRIAAKAGAAEILIPEPVRHLLSGKSYVYADRGEFAPKGFDDAVRLYEVRWRE